MKYLIIKTVEQYKNYCKRAKELYNLKKPDSDQKEEMELLDLLIETYESSKYKSKELNPIELLKYLMENHNMTREDLIKVLNINKSAISQILNYRKGLSKEVIRKLSDHFKVSQDAFNRPYELVMN